MSYPPHTGYPPPHMGYGYQPTPPPSQSSGIGFEGFATPPQPHYQDGYAAPAMAMPAPSPGYTAPHVMHAPGYGTPPSYGMPMQSAPMTFGGVATAASAATVFRSGGAYVDGYYAAPSSTPPYSAVTVQTAPMYHTTPPTAPPFAAPSAPPSAPPASPPSVPPSESPTAPSQYTYSSSSPPAVPHTPPHHTPAPVLSPAAPVNGSRDSVRSSSGSARPSTLKHSSSFPETNPPRPVERTGSGKKSRTQGTVKDFKPFFPEKDAETLRKAMKGLGCDSKAVLHIISTKSNQQRQEISQHFKSLYERDLMKDLKSELGGHFEGVILSLMRVPPVCDAHNLRKAMKGIGTDEDTLIEILCSRSNAEIRAFTQSYRDEYSRDLEKDIVSETSGHFKKFLVALLKAEREENVPVDYNQANNDAMSLYKAGEGRWGTDESTFNQVFSRRNFDQLIATFDCYKRAYNCDIEESISKEISGDLKESFIAIIRCARNTPAYFAERLYKSLKGKNDDSTIIRIIVSRSEIDMVQIKEEFIKKYGQTLAKWIVDNTKGNYKNCLLQLIGERTL